jgi:hypothetical protein
MVNDDFLLTLYKTGWKTPIVSSWDLTDDDIDPDDFNHRDYLAVRMVDNKLEWISSANPTEIMTTPPASYEEYAIIQHQNMASISTVQFRILITPLFTVVKDMIEEVVWKFSEAGVSVGDIHPGESVWRNYFPHGASAPSIEVQ